MSATAPARIRPQPEVQTARAALRLVASRPLHVSRLPFAIFVGAILAVGLVALLLLHTMAAQDAFRLQALEHQSAALDDTEQQLAIAEEQEQAPATLAARARSLGMVPTGSIAYVKLHHHGKIVGVVRAAQPPPPPPAPTPTATAAPSSKASAAATTAHHHAHTRAPHRASARAHRHG